MATDLARAAIGGVTVVLVLTACASAGGQERPTESDPRVTVDADDLPTAPTVEGDLPTVTLSEGTPPTAPPLATPSSTTGHPTPSTTEPTTPPTTLVTTCASWTLQGPLFAPASADLDASPATAAVLDELATRLKGTTGTISIEGHTDRRPVAGGNQALSERRAQAVRAALTSRDVSQDRMTIVGWGDRRPVDSADTSEAHARNRRVEIIVVCPS